MNFTGFSNNYPACRPAACKQFQLGYTQFEHERIRYLVGSSFQDGMTLNKNYRNFLFKPVCILTVHWVLLNFKIML